MWCSSLEHHPVVTEEGSWTSSIVHDPLGNRYTVFIDHAEGTERGLGGENFASDIAAGDMQRVRFLQDHLGSDVAALDANGNVLWHMMYDPWGRPLLETYTDANRSGIQLVSFTSYSWDEVLGLYFAQNRFYDPVSRRFTQVDPIRDGSNWYAYVYNNPVNFIDPLGLKGTTKARTPVPSTPARTQTRTAPKTPAAPSQPVRPAPPAPPPPPRAPQPKLPTPNQPAAFRAAEQQSNAQFQAWEAQQKQPPPVPPPPPNPIHNPVAIRAKNEFQAMGCRMEAFRASDVLISGGLDLGGAAMVAASMDPTRVFRMAEPPVYNPATRAELQPAHLPLADVQQFLQTHLDSSPTVGPWGGVFAAQSRDQTETRTAYPPGIWEWISPVVGSGGIRTTTTTGNSALVTGYSQTRTGDALRSSVGVDIGRVNISLGLDNVGISYSHPSGGGGASTIGVRVDPSRLSVGLEHATTRPLTQNTTQTTFTNISVNAKPALILIPALILGPIFA